MTKDNKKRNAAIAGAGVVGVAAVPVKTSPPKQDKSVKRRLKLSSVTHSARVSDLRDVGRPEGDRLYNERHVKNLASKISQKGFDRNSPVEVNRYDDGSYKIKNGMHRIRASEYAGKKKIPVKVTRVKGTQKTRKPLISAFIDSYQYKKARKHSSKLSNEELKKPKPVPAAADKFNNFKQAFDQKHGGKVKYAAAVPVVGAVGVAGYKKKDEIKRSLTHLRD